MSWEIPRLYCPVTWWQQWKVNGHHPEELNVAQINRINVWWCLGGLYSLTLIQSQFRWFLHRLLPPPTPIISGSPSGLCLLWPLGIVLTWLPASPCQMAFLPFSSDRTGPGFICGFSAVRRSCFFGDYNTPVCCLSVNRMNQLEYLQWCFPERNRLQHCPGRVCSWLLCTLTFILFILHFDSVRGLAKGGGRNR